MELFNNPDYGELDAADIDIDEWNAEHPEVVANILVTDEDPDPKDVIDFDVEADA